MSEVEIVSGQLLIINLVRNHFACELLEFEVDFPH